MPKRILKGKITSAKMKNTVVVAVTSLKSHPKYKKIIKVTNKYKAHYEGADVKVGDTVSIVESKPISKDKHWVVAEIFKTVVASPEEITPNTEV